MASHSPASTSLAPAPLVQPGGGRPIPPPRFTGIFTLEEAAAEAALAVREQPPPPGPQACNSSALPPSERLMLTLVAGVYHGSTALEQTLMSAPNVATMCNGMQWQCEVQAGTADDSKRCMNCDPRHHRHELSVSEPHKCLACASPPFAENNTAAFRLTLDVFEPFWAAQPNRSVLAVKWAPLLSGPVEGPKRGSSGLRWHDDVPDPPEQSWRRFETRGVPASLAAAGVQRVRWALVLMHRPWCLWRLDRHAREDREGRGVAHWAWSELMEVEHLVALHRKLSQAGMPALVTSLADLLWPEVGTQRTLHARHRAADRLQAFAPCAGRVELGFEPVMGRDVFELNLMKTCDGDGGCSSVRSYGDANPPASVSFDASLGRCAEAPEQLYAGLDADGRARAAAAEDYLLSLAATAPVPA